MSCKCGCSICPRAIFSQSVTVVTVDGVDTLVIDIPAGIYGNCKRYCLFIIDAIPATATIGMPVAISIGGVTTTVYPLTRCDCVQVTACAIRTRRRYPVVVSTSATGGVFKVLRGLSCSPNNALATLPVDEAAAVVANLEVASFSTPRNVTKTTTTKTVVKTD